MFSFCALIPTVACDTSELPLRLNSAIWPMIFVRPFVTTTYIPGSAGKTSAVCPETPTATNIDSGVDKHELPERNLRRRSICGISGNRTALRQYFHVGIDVRPESDFDNVTGPTGSQSANSLRLTEKRWAVDCEARFRVWHGFWYDHHHIASTSDAR
jgi:hypothetical protein